MEDQEKEPSKDTLVKVILRIIGFGVALAALVYGMLVYKGHYKKPADRPISWFDFAT